MLLASKIMNGLWVFILLFRIHQLISNAECLWQYESEHILLCCCYVANVDVAPKYHCGKKYFEDSTRDGVRENDNPDHTHPIYNAIICVGNIRKEENGKIKREKSGKILNI